MLARFGVVMGLGLLVFGSARALDVSVAPFNLAAVWLPIPPVTLALGALLIGNGLWRGRTGDS